MLRAKKRAQGITSFIYFLVFAGILFAMFVWIVSNKVNSAIKDTTYVKRFYARDMALLVDSMHAADGNFSIGYEMLWDFDVNLTPEKIILTENIDKPFDRKGQIAFLFGRNKYVNIEPGSVDGTHIYHDFKLESGNISMELPSEDIVLPPNPNE